MLASPQIPENIGLVARVLKNIDCARLAIVTGMLAPKSFETAKRARDILENSPVYPTLDQALSSAHFVYGTTRRRRQYRTVYNFQDMVPTIVNLASHRKVHIVFGKENFGLSQEEIEKCDDIFYIPANPGFPSYNLASSVGIVCYTISQYVEKTVTLSKFDIASHKDRQALFAFMEESLLTRRIKQSQAKSLTNTFRRIFSRTQLTRREVEGLKSFFLKLR